MPIVQRSRAKQYFVRLEERINRLKQVLEGHEPNMSLWDFYSLNEADYKRDFVEIDQTDLSIALGDVENLIKELKKARTLKADKLHNPN